MTTTESIREDLEPILRSEGFQIRSAGTVDEARAALQDGLSSLALIDSALPDGSGLSFFGELREQGAVEAILVGSAGPLMEAERSLGLGARERIVKPFRAAEVRALTAYLRRKVRFRGEVGLLKLGLVSHGRFGALVGTSHAMQGVYDLVSRASQSDATVLLTGESGTGKELVARTLHELSPRADRPFLAINCGAVLSGMIDNELFGHAKGSFTGADRVHTGIFSRAHGGTLLLDEIADMPMELQVKLLRTLETRSIMPVGGEKEVPVDVRIVAATNRIPEDAVSESRLREDLFYRLRVLRIHLPPLRERPGDVRLLTGEFLADLNKEAGTAKIMSPEALTLLESQPWWGNVRELRNTVQEAFIVADRRIEASTVSRLVTGWSDSAMQPPAAAEASAGVKASPVRVPGDAGMQLVPGISTLADAERQLILATLAVCHGNRTKTAKILGVNPKTLYTRLLAYRHEEARRPNGNPSQ